MDRELVNVFPVYAAVLFPSASLPLNVFEHRYVKMIRDSINEHRPIAVVTNNNLETVVGIGYPQIINEHADGTLFVMLKGIGKVRLVEKASDEIYKVYQAERVLESTEFEDENRFKLNRLAKTLKGWLDLNIKSKEDRETFLKKIQTPNELVAYAAHFLLEDTNQKLIVLHESNLNTRLELILEFTCHKAQIDSSLQGKILAIS